MRITLLGHSGFLVEGDKATLVFDYYTDEHQLLCGALGHKPVTFLVSHRHGDHYNRAIFAHAQERGVAYVLDGAIEPPAGVDALRLTKGQQGEVDELSVRAYGSTDEGISFLCGFEGRTLFHAGDLNCWYWEDESTEEELRHDEQWFLDEIAPLANLRPDVAFFPVDQRLGRHALRGPLQFAESVQPKLLVPMHLSGGIELPQQLQQALDDKGIQTRVAQIASPGDSIEL